MKTIVREISLAELAEKVNEARMEKVGYEFFFGEYLNGEELNVDDVQGWHTCTKINDREVCVRYMGGVCFGLITDSNVTEEDMLAYLESAANFGGVDENTKVYLEEDLPSNVKKAYNILDKLRFDYGYEDYSRIDVVFNTLLLIVDIDGNHTTTMGTFYTLGGLTSDFSNEYANSDTYADDVKVVVGEKTITLMFECVE